MSSDLHPYPWAWRQKEKEKPAEPVNNPETSDADAEGEDAKNKKTPEEKQREEIGSDFYRGGMVVGRAGHLHPALYFKGLLDLVEREKTKILARAPVLSLAQTKGSIDVVTSRGTIKARDVIVATNGYTGDATPEFKRRVVPIGSMCSGV